MRPRTVLLLFALALLATVNWGCAFFKENPSDRSCDLADTATKYAAAALSKPLFPVALVDLIITRLGQHRAFGMQPVNSTPAGADAKAANVQQQESRSKALDGTAAGLNAPWPRPTPEDLEFIRRALREQPEPRYKPGADPAEILRRFPPEPLYPPQPRRRQSQAVSREPQKLEARSSKLEAADGPARPRPPQVTMIEINGRFVEVPR